MRLWEKEMRSISSHGRLVPLGSDFVYSQEDRRYFFLDQPSLDLIKIYSRYKRSFNGGIEISEDDFVSRIEELSASLTNSPQEAPILNGVHVPFIIPKSFMNLDLGTALVKLINSIEQSFTTAYPDFEFKNFAEPNLSGKVKINQDSRLDTLYNQLQNGDIIGLYFPTFFSGFAIQSQRNAISSLPPRMHLSGALEIASALIGTPDLLIKKGDNYPNGLSLSGVEPMDRESENFFWYFEAYGWNLNFNYRSMIGPASEYFSGGISIAT
jgi:hypothetical protein